MRSWTSRALRALAAARALRSTRVSATRLARDFAASARPALPEPRAARSRRSRAFTIARPSPTTVDVEASEADSSPHVAVAVDVTDAGTRTTTSRTAEPRTF